MLTREQVQAKIETSYCVSVRNVKNTAFFDLGCDEIDDFWNSVEVPFNVYGYEFD